MDTFDRTWEQIHQEQEWGRYPSEEVIRFVARNYYKSERKSTKILDFGCGTGAVTWYLAKEGFDAYGFDGSETAIKKAKIRLQEEMLLASFEVCDASHLNYPSDFFDALIDSAVIYANKIEHIKTILNEAYRVLKKGGKIFSTGLFNCKTTGYGTGSKLEDNTYNELTQGALSHRGTVHFFTIAEVLEFWHLAGFNNISVDELERTDNGGKMVISYYMVEAQK